MFPNFETLFRAQHWYQVPHVYTLRTHTTYYILRIHTTYYILRRINMPSYNAGDLRCKWLLQSESESKSTLCTKKSLIRTACAGLCCTSYGQSVCMVSVKDLQTPTRGHTILCAVRLRDQGVDLSAVPQSVLSRTPAVSFKPLSACYKVETQANSSNPRTVRVPRTQQIRTFQAETHTVDILGAVLYSTWTNAVVIGLPGPTVPIYADQDMPHHKWQSMSLDLATLTLSNSHSLTG